MRKKKIKNAVRILFLVLFSILFILSTLIVINSAFICLKSMVQHSFDYLSFYLSGFFLLEILSSLLMILILLIIKDENIINDQIKKTTKTTLLMIVGENLYFRLLTPLFFLFCYYLPHSFILPWSTDGLSGIIKIIIGVYIFFYYPTVIVLSVISIVLLIKSKKLIKQGRQAEMIQQNECVS